MQVDKKSVIQVLLMQAESVFVHLDPTRDMVLVPPHLKKGPVLVLEIGMNMRVPIPDLEVLDEGINATLSFGGKPYPCWIPWHSVFALVTPDKKAMMWQEDVPEQVAESYLPPDALRARRTQRKKTRPHLVAVEESDGDDAEVGAEAGLEADESGLMADTQPDKERTLAHVRQEPSEFSAGDMRVMEAMGRDDVADSDESELPSAAGAELEDAPSGDSDPPAAKRPLPPYLRVVK